MGLHPAAQHNAIATKQSVAHEQQRLHADQHPVEAVVIRTVCSDLLVELGGRFLVVSYRYCIRWVRQKPLNRFEVHHVLSGN